VVAIVACSTFFLQAEWGGPNYVGIARGIIIVTVAITLAKKWPALRRRRAHDSLQLLPENGFVVGNS
jgi:hypothetical protein